MEPDNPDIQQSSPRSDDFKDCTDEAEQADENTDLV